MHRNRGFKRVSTVYVWFLHTSSMCGSRSIALAVYMCCANLKYDGKGLSRFRAGPRSDRVLIVQQVPIPQSATSTFFAYTRT